jgi:general secretion pathway protein H
MPAESMTVPTPSEGTIGARRVSGFTLVEILVVLVIIGVVIAVALLSFGILGDGRGLDREARRMSALIEMAADEAMIQGRDYGLEILQGGYRFVEYDPLIDQWHEVIGDDLLRARTLEEGSEFELFIEDHKVLLETKAESLDENVDDEDERKRDLADDYLPHILILSSGDVTPFELTLQRFVDRSEVTLSMSLAGELEINRGDEDES